MLHSAHSRLGDNSSGLLVFAMEDVSPVEDEKDKNLTRIINEMVNKSLDGDSDSSNPVLLTHLNETSSTPVNGDDSGDDEFEDADEDVPGPSEKEPDNKTKSTTPSPVVTTTMSPVVTTTKSPVATTTKSPVATTTTPRPVLSTTTTTTARGPERTTPTTRGPVGSTPTTKVPEKDPDHCRSCPGVKCSPCEEFLPCVPVPCEPVDQHSPPGTGDSGATPMSVPVALAVGATASLLAVGLVAGVGIILRYLPSFISGLILVVAVILIWYLSSHYPATARQLGQRALDLMREASTTLVNRAMAALRGSNQVSFCFEVVLKPSLSINICERP